MYFNLAENAGAAIVAIVSHDAGGAEVLANYVEQNKISCQYVLDGPAVGIFKRRFGEIEIVSLEEGLLACNAVLCSTSWQSDLEWSAIRESRQRGIPVFAFLDHWMNYQERFIRNGILCLPDELWIGDDDALSHAQKVFPDTPLRLVPNPYFIEVKRQIAELELKRPMIVAASRTALFVSENISGFSLVRYGNERYLGYTEFDAIEYFLDNLSALGEDIGTVVIRPHPSDPQGKYSAVLSKSPSLLRLSEGKPLFEEIVESDIVVGSQSMAMVIGLLAGKKVVSCIPPGGSGCSLPQKSILHFKDLVASKQGFP